jgi:hypothetical protein
MVEEVRGKKKDGFSPEVLHTHFDPRRDFEFVNLVCKIKKIPPSKRS